MPLEDPALLISEILRQVRQGDRKAFDALIDRFWDTVLRFVWKRLHSAGDAEEVTQTVFVSLYRTLRRGGGPRSDESEVLRRYLFASARNAVLDRNRRKGMGPPLASLEALFEQGEYPFSATRRTVPDLLVSEEDAWALRECLGALDLLPRAVIWLHHVDGLSQRQIARGLEMPDSSLRNLVLRALKQLRGCLKAKGITPEGSGGRP